MTPARYMKCLDALRLSQRQLAPILGCSQRLPQIWGTERNTIPPKVADWLEDCVAMRKRFPDPKPPRDWRRPPGPKPVEKPEPAPKKRAVRRRRPGKRRPVGRPRTRSIVPF